MKDDYNGILLVDKPAGWTSFDVVAKVRGILQADLKARNNGVKIKLKVGHTGTLDPSATGLLVLCIGKYTKKVPDMIKHDKTYEAELTLGATSTTGDGEGVITQISELRSQSLDELVPRSKIQGPRSLETIKQVLERFVGEQLQTPPAFSALKVNGQRSYDLARAGKEVKHEPRKITIHTIDLTSYEWPKLKITCSVSSGTYIRSLAEDIGAKLGTGAYLSGLRRTVVDVYSLENAVRVDDLNAQMIREATRE